MVMTRVVCQEALLCGSSDVLLVFACQTRLEELHRLWDLLLQKTREKGERLLQAQKLVQYLRECEDALEWISDKVRMPH